MNMKKSFFLIGILCTYWCYGRTGDATDRIGTGVVVGIMGMLIVGIINWVTSNNKNKNKPL